MRVLFLTPQPPYPPHAGNALRTLGLLHGLHDAGARIDLLTFVDPGLPDPLTTPAVDLCERIVSVPTPKRRITARLRDLLLSGKADMASRFTSDHYTAELTRLLSQPGARYDLIQFEGLEMAVYLPLVKRLAPGCKVIYGAANAEFELQHLIFANDRGRLGRLPASLYSLIQWQRLRAYERRVCQTVTQVIATSQFDADAFKSLDPSVRVSVVPNGIYVQEYMQPDAPAAAQLDLGDHALLFTGSMGYRPNVDAILWFTDEVLREVQALAPQVRLFVVGKNPHPRLDALRQRPEVQLTGFVQDITPFLHRAAVFVAPLRTGSGTRLKLLQAMAAGCAVVSTTVGAQGITITPGREMIIADTAAAFAQGIVALLNDPARREAMGAAAQAFVCENYDWAVIVPLLLQVYRGLGVMPPPLPNPTPTLTEGARVG